MTMIRTEATHQNKTQKSQVDGNVSESNDCSEEIDFDGFKVLARTLKCAVSCDKVFTTE